MCYGIQKMAQTASSLYSSMGTAMIQKEKSSDDHKQTKEGENEHKMRTRESEEDACCLHDSMTLRRNF